MGINTTLLFFLLLIPLSGVIALAGDRIGHRIGKRRQSLFGLRPRHTATLFTVGSGIGIALVSFALMAASSQGFRLVLARGTELLRENRRLDADNRRLEGQARDAVAQIEALREAAGKADGERKAAEAARDASKRREIEAERQFASARRNVEAAVRDLTRERERLGVAQSSLRRAEAQVRDARGRLGSAEMARAQARRETVAAETRAAAARKEAMQAHVRVADATRTFQETTRYQTERINAQRAEIARQNERIEATNASLAESSRQVAAQRKELDRLAAEVTQLEARRTETQLALAQMSQSAAALRANRITYRVGEEVARASLAPGMNVWRVRNHLEGLLAAAGKKAETRGARLGPGVFRAVAIPTRVAEEQGKREVVTEADVLREVALNIRRANEDVVVIAVASVNAVIGEPVAIDLRTFRNPRILASGDALGATSIDGTRTRQEVADALYAFLRQEVRPRLTALGAIPPLLGPSEAEDEGPNLVTLTGDEWLKILEDLRQAGARAHLTVRAAQDLRAADPVALVFEVKGPPVAAVSTQQ